MRPVAMSRDQALAVIERFAEGQLLSHLLPNGRQYLEFFAALEADEELGRAYTRCESALAEQMARETVHIADNEKDAAIGRNRIQARQWYAAKTKPRKFGDRLDVHHEVRLDATGAMARAEARIAEALPQRYLTAHLIPCDPHHPPIDEASTSDDPSERPAEVGPGGAEDRVRDGDFVGENRDR